MYVCQEEREEVVVLDNVRMREEEAGWGNERITTGLFN